MTVATPELLTRFDVSGPRYTSYPTADRFVEAFGEDDYVLALKQRHLGSAAKAMPLSLYVHIPFCESLCYYCACNKIITKHHDRADVYLRYLSREVDLHTAHCGTGQVVSQLHLGGGTPTFLSDDGLRELMDTLRRSFTLVPGGEYSIEVDPRTVDAGRLKVLAELGFNRLSFGVQDFDPEVQKAVHRVQPAEQVFALVESARAIGFDSINVDLIYGLPKQTPDSFDRTLAQVNELRPDRIALYAYAHLPERFKPLPEDALAVAKRQGRLHRNFQGYSTQPDCDLIALGVSAIGRVGTTYSQNAKTLEEYYDRLNQGHLPIVRGLALSRDDLVRRAVIMALMCQGALTIESVEQAWLIDFRTYFARELEQLAEMEQQGLVELSTEGVQVTAMGWYFVRGIAMVFDRYLQSDRNRARFSRII